MKRRNVKIQDIFGIFKEKYEKLKWVKGRKDDELHKKSL